MLTDEERDEQFQRIRAADARAVRATLGSASQVTPSNLGRPTPCAEWTVADLLQHMTIQHRGFAAAARGAGHDPRVWLPQPNLPEPNLPQPNLPQPNRTDPADDYAQAAEDVIQAFATLGTRDQPFALPEIDATVTFPATVAIGFHFIDYLVHGWDLARALGLAFQPPDDLVRLAGPIADRVPGGPARTRKGAAFAPAIDGPAILDPFHRILSGLGRSPNWPGVR